MKITGVYNKPAGRSVEIAPKSFTFPGGEVQVNVDHLESEGLKNVVIKAHLKSAGSIMELLLVTDALRRRIGSAPISLIMPYVPYARQDRVCNPGEALGVKVFCNIINSQGYASVTILDPHSDVASALLDRVVVIDQSAQIDQVLRDPAFANGVTLVSPDSGAAKKVLKLAKRFNIKDVIFADKVRDTKTGEIMSIDIRGYAPVRQPLLVVDDICDGGRTFIELAKALLDIAPITPAYLYVSHGIFSKGTLILRDCYAKIFTTNDWTNEKCSAVEVINMKGFA